MRGLCECGCGGLPAIAVKTDARLGNVKGQPRRFIRGHQNRKTIAPPSGYEISETGCWLWMLRLDRKGYAWGTRGGRQGYMHVLMYEERFGPVPDGLELDHLCRTPRCINPDHLEAVTPTENKRRSSATKLDARAVAFIRSTSETNAALAVRFGVDPSNISHIRASRSWKEIEAV